MMITVAIKVIDNNDDMIDDNDVVLQNDNLAITEPAVDQHQTAVRL